MKKVVLVLLVIVGLFSNVKVYAQGEAGVMFLKLAPDSRAGGLGESGAGLADNASAIFWNPAGLAFLKGTEISVTHSNWLPQLGLSDLFYEYLAFRHYVDDLGGAISSSITYMNFGEFIQTSESGVQIGTFRSFDIAVTAGYSTKISQDWGIGTNIRLIHSKLSGENTQVGQEQGKGQATAVSVDLGFMWRPLELDIPFIGEFNNRLSIGANISNMGPHISYIDKDQADPLPLNFRLGFALRAMEDDYNTLTLTMDFNKMLIDKRKSIDGETVKKDPFYKTLFTAWGDEPFKDELKDITSSLGVEYVYGTPTDFLIALRGGFFYEDPNRGNRKFVTLGAGIQYGNLGFDFSYITTAVFKDGADHPLSETLRFSVAFGWDTLRETNKGFPRGL